MLQFDRKARPAFFIVCVALALSGLGLQWAVGYLNVYLQKERVELRDNLGNISRNLGPWKKIGQDQVLDDAMIETLGTQYYLSRNYAVNGEPAEGVMQLHVAYYTGFIDEIPHVPNRCFVAGGLREKTLREDVEMSISREGWYDDPVNMHTAGQPYPVAPYRHPITGSPVEVRMPIGDFNIRVTEFQNPKSPDQRIYAGYFFIANGRTTSVPLEIKALAFNLTEKYAYYAKVQFTMAGGEDFDQERFLEAVSSLVNPLLPELMRCLPDWAEVTRIPKPDSGIVD